MIRLLLAIIHAVLGHPIDDYREDGVGGNAWCASCGAKLEPIDL